MEDTYSHYSRIVENYSRYRPRYPHQLMEWLRAECDLSPAHTVADIGSGTGLMAELFLKNGNQVYGVEPIWKCARPLNISYAHTPCLPA